MNVALQMEIGDFPGPGEKEEGGGGADFFFSSQYITMADLHAIAQGTKVHGQTLSQADAPAVGTRWGKVARLRPSSRAAAAVESKTNRDIPNKYGYQRLKNAYFHF